MNREELLAKKYLESLNQSSITYEPDGNIPPDFLVDNHIAVEVTRLNEHIEVQGVLKRLDDDSSTKPVFMLGEISDHDIGGYVYEDLSKNVGYCVESKSSKIQAYQSKYEEWWLILIDSIAYGCYPEYIDDFKATFDKDSFNKVIVLEAIHGQYVFEI